VSHHRAFIVVVALLAMISTVVAPWSRPPAPGAQGVEVFLNVTGRGAKKLNIVIPEFTVVAGTDVGAAAPLLASVTGADLLFSRRFAVVGNGGKLPANDPDRLRKAMAEFAGLGAHALLHGLLSVKGDRLETEMRLYDLTAADHRLITSKAFAMDAARVRRLAHKMADEVVLQFTGEAGVADTRIAYVTGRPGAKEIVIADYDNHHATMMTRNGSINLQPVWAPDTRSLVFTSFVNGYPDLHRAFPFGQKPEEPIAQYRGLNTSPSWSPDGREVAMTLSKDGSPNIYVHNFATGTLRRLTRHRGIDAEPTWSPTGHQIAFVSDRAGRPHIFVMDPDGNNVRQLSSGGHHTQPRWSPKGDRIAFTIRAGNHDIWTMKSDGSGVRRLTSGPRDNASPTWSPDGRLIIFQSNRSQGWQLFSMLADGSEQAALTRGPAEAMSPSWSARLP
jgi:TolB protein